MQLTQFISFLAFRSEPSLDAAIGRLKAAGYRVTRKRKTGATEYEIRVPPGDTAWEAEIDSLTSSFAIRALDIGERVEYSDEDFREAGLFSFYLKPGASVDIPPGPDYILGLADIADWDESAMCGSCGAGIAQRSPMRIPASALSKKRMISETGLDVGGDLMISDQIRLALLDQFGIELPLLEIEQTGRGKRRERWWQVLPIMILPPDRLVCVNMKAIECPECKADRWRRDNPEENSGTYLRKGVFQPEAIDAAVWSPGWSDEIHRAEDGRLLSAPQQSIYLRGDVGRAFLALGLKQINLIPLEWRDD